MTSHAVVVEHLSHQYPSGGRKRRHANLAGRTALGDVTFTVEHGEIFGILGPNSSGKTTLFRILATLLHPHPARSISTRSGRASIFGYDPTYQPQFVRTQLGVVFQSPSVDTKLTVQENLLHQGRLHGLGGLHLRRRIDQSLSSFGLADRRHDYVETLSGGMRRRLDLAKALLHEPPLLLMDEPTAGLDPGARRDLWQHLAELRQQQGTTIILTTHLMDDADRCDRLLILSAGRLVVVDSPAHLKARIGGEVVTVHGDPTAADNHPSRLAELIHQRMGPWEQEASPKVVDGAIRFQKPDAAELPAALTTAFPGRIQSITIGRPTLDDVFLHLTGASFEARS